MSDPFKGTEVTRQRLNHTLSEELGQITAFNIEVIGEGAGVLGELARIQLSMSEAPILGGALIDLSKARSRPLVHTLTARAVACIEGTGSLPIVRQL